jgi:hypothetical protein
MRLPHNFIPRWYQTKFYNAMADGYKRGVAVWHRRAGKDKTTINILVKEAFKRKGLYFYLFPTYKQAKKAIWYGMDRDGFRFLDHIPTGIRRRTNETEMLVELSNGSIIQVVGSDNYDALMGSNPLGCIFSEYSIQDPRAWEFIKPILRENKGWAFFIYTPRGHTAGYRMYNMALENPDWFCEKLTIDDTGVLNELDMQAERAEGMSEDLIQQEYYCSFEAALPGAYYAKEMALADKENRITGVPYQPGFVVDTYWDLGYRDSTAIWFGQDAGREVHLIDYYEASGEGLAHYKKIMTDPDYCEKNNVPPKNYTYGAHYAPHDIKKHELGTGKTLWEQSKTLGIKFEMMPRLSLSDGIEATRQIIAICWFDRKKCARGIDALRSYRKEYDEEHRAFRLIPVHDWASDGADAFRTLGVCHRFEEKKEEMKDIDYGDPDDYAGYYPGGL